MVAQVWRGGARQAGLARALPMIDVLPAHLDAARAAGALLRETGGEDVVDALLALVVRPGDQVLTSDPRDLGGLVAAREVPASVIAV